MNATVNILRLTLKKTPFQVMVTGEKKEEFRLPSDWIKSRLFNKDGSVRQYDCIEYVNGYGKCRPRFVTDYQGFDLIDSGIFKTYSNGLTLKINEPVFVIKHSRVLSVSNLSN